MGLQLFIGSSPWDHKPLIEVLVNQVGTAIGEADAVISFDPLAFPEKGNKSVGIQRQWRGRLGTVDSRQVGVFMGYAFARRTIAGEPATLSSDTPTRGLRYNRTKRQGSHSLVRSN